MTNNQIILPLDLGLVLPDDAPVRTLFMVTERMDFTQLYSIYRNNSAHKKYSPKLLFQIVLLGYMNELISSRKIERACKDHISFMWLLQGQSAPDHNTINRFRNDISQVFDDLFAQFIDLLMEMGEISHEHVFIDGTKIQSFANHYTWVWQKSVKKHDEKMQNKIKDFIKEINRTYSCKYKFSVKNQARLLKEIQAYLKTEIENQGVQFVYGKGKRKTILQRDYEKITSYLERRLRYDEDYKILAGRNSYSKTDHDATFMRMKEDHMMNGQLKPAYNVQVAASGGYCVGVNIYSDRADVVTLIPFLSYLEDKIGIKYRYIVADAGYESEENYAYLRTSEQIAMIKPSNYERSKKRTFKTDIRLIENMSYNEEEDYYVCSNNKKLLYVQSRDMQTRTGYVSQKKIYECEDCSDCVMKSKCTRAKGNRTLQISELFVELRSESRDNITSDLGKQLRVNRSIQAEGLFGTLKGNHNFRRFLTKNKNNVHTEIRFMMLGMNITKLHNKRMNDNLGYALYEAKAG